MAMQLDIQEVEDVKTITQEQFDQLYVKQQNIIGRGSFGDVYKGTAKDGTKVAIKKFNKLAKKSTQSILNEISIIQILKHPSFIKFLGCYKVGNQHDKDYYMITEFAENGNLERQKQRIKTMELKDRLHWCWQIADGVNVLHQRNLMHRDIKPQNILVDKDFNLKICDFGCCKQDNISLTWQTSTGTPTYMDPKVLTGKYSKKCDIYSLGLVMFFILSGQQVFANVITRDQLDRQIKNFFSRTDDYFKILPVEREIKQLLKACVKQNEVSRIEIKELLQKLQYFQDKYSITKENSMKSTLVYSQENGKLSQIDLKVIEIIDLKPVYSHKQSVQRVKKQILQMLQKAKRKVLQVTKVSLLTLQNYKKEILVFLCICYYIRCMSSFKKWASRVQAIRLPSLFDKIDFEDLGQKVYSRKYDQKFCDSAYGQFVSENIIPGKKFVIDAFDQQTQQMFKRIANQQIQKYQKELFRISSQITRKMPVIGTDITHLLKDIVRQVEQHEHKTIIERFSQQDIRNQYSNFFITKVAKDKEAENMKNSEVFEVYKVFREFINNLDDFY